MKPSQCPCGEPRPVDDWPGGFVVPDDWLDDFIRDLTADVIRAYRSASQDVATAPEVETGPPPWQDVDDLDERSRIAEEWAAKQVAAQGPEERVEGALSRPFLLNTLPQVRVCPNCKRVVWCSPLLPRQAGRDEDEQPN